MKGGFLTEAMEEEEDGEEQDAWRPEGGRDGKIEGIGGRRGSWGGHAEEGVRVGAEEGGDCDAYGHERDDSDGPSLGQTRQPADTMTGCASVAQAGPEPHEEATEDVGSGREEQGGRGRIKDQGGCKCGNQKG